LRELDLEVPQGFDPGSVVVKMEGRTVPCRVKVEGHRLVLYFRDLVVEEGRALDVSVLVRGM